jgi:TP901 family phage tail tape measure protein
MALRGSVAARVGIEIGAALAGNFKSVFGSANAELTKVGSTIKGLEARQRELNAVIKEQERLGRKGSPLKAMYAQQEMDAITGRVVKLRQEQERLLAVESRRQANLGRRSDAQSALPGAIGTAVSVGLPVIGAMGKASEYGYQLQLIANTADMTEKQTRALGQTILEASRKTNSSAEEMQRAMGFLVAAGMDIGTAQASLLQVGRTATASGAEIEDLSKAAFTLTDALKIAPGKGLADAMDTLAQAGKEGNVELKDMARQLPVLGSGFVALKMEGREAAATIAASLQIARKGAANADEAANNMRNFIAKVMSPETLKKAQAEFGLDLYKVIQDAQTQGGNPFEESVKAIMKATEGDQKKIGELFQDMQVQNFIRPMIQNFQEYERIKAAAMSASGVTDRDFEKIMDTAKMQTKAFSSEVGRLAIALGGPLTVALGAVTGVLTPVVHAMTEFANQNPILTASIVGVVVGLAALRVAVLAATFAWTFITPALAAGATAFGYVLTAVKALGTAFLWLGRVMLLNPIGLSFTLLATAGFLLWQNWEGVKGGLVAIWETIKSTAIAAFDAIRSSVGAVIDWLAEKTAWIFATVDKVKAAANSIGGALGGAWDGAKSWATGDTTPAASAPVPNGRSGSVVQQSTNQYSIKIEGGDPAANAKALSAELDRRERERAARQRGALVDALGY